jgi:cell division septation protein DedD
VYSFQLNDNTFLPVRLRSESNRVENTAPPVETPPQTVAATQHSSGSYVIVGCFSSASNAEQLVKTLRSKGFDAKTLPGEGLIRVSAGDGAQFSQLQPKLQAEGLSGWVLK